MTGHGLADGATRWDTRDTISEAASVAGRMLDGPRPPTAVIGVSDTVAVGALHAARARGLAVGRDLSIIGFDDTPSAALLTPSLTSISQPLEEAARLLVEMLVARLAGRRLKQRSVLLEPALVVRDSTGPAPG